MSEVGNKILSVIEGSSNLAELENVLSNNSKDQYSDDRAVRGIYRLGTLLMQSPDKVKDYQFTNRLNELIKEVDTEQ
jgi:hypothetical protein